jgi:RNA polymerase sigma factor (sigma-70 family)
MSHKERTDATLWDAYLADRSDANRNAIFEHYYGWISRRVEYLLSRCRCEHLFDEVLSAVSDRILRIVIPEYSRERCKFRTYLRHHLKGGVNDALRSLYPRGLSAGRRVIRVREARVQLSHQLGRRANDAEVAEYLDLPERAVIAASPPPDRQGDWDGAFAPNIGNNRVSRGIIPVAKPDCSDEEWEQLVSGLRPQSAEILRLYWKENLTLAEVGVAMQMSESAVSLRISGIYKFLREKRKNRRSSYDR